MLEVGDAAAPAPVVGGDSSPEPIKPPVGLLMPGFDYGVADAVVSSRRIRLSSSSQQPFSSWCNGFEPIANEQSPGDFMCLPNTGWSYNPAEGCRLSDAQRTPVDCGKTHCIRLCTCDADSCDAVTSPGDVQIDAALGNEGEELTGTLLVGSERIYVRMQRTP